MNRYSLFIALAATSFTAPAVHAEAFNGGYIGAIAGYDKLSLKASAGGATGSVSGDSVSGGIVLGYNATIGDSIVIGAELDALIGGGKIDTVANDLETDYTATAGVRAGFLVTPTVLVYGKAAYARTRLSVANDGENGDGFAFGGGVEVAFAKSISGRIAYTRTNYSVDDEIQAAFGGNIDLNRDQVMAGVAFHF